ncbi:MAG: VanZ family protein [Anaerolineales bacterium]|nr:VanZ family protein [Anaerolineales bacterium]
MFSPIPFLMGLTAFLPVLMILRRQKRSLTYQVGFGLFWVYLVIVLVITVFPIPVSENLPSLWTKERIIFTLSRVNLLPFSYLDFFNKRIVVQEILRNILLTIPFGLSIQWFRRFSPKEMIYLALLPGLIIETSQLAISLGLAGSYRAVDVTDIILNTLGVWLGYTLFILIAPRLPISIPLT